MAPPLHGFYRLVALGEVASTNDEALARVRAGAPEGTLVVAQRQTAGRGRRGRAWESPPGNLHLSLVLQPTAGLAAAVAVGFAAALAARGAIVRGLPPGHSVELKWPNDVLIDGAKAAGVLIETADDALVLGVGINIARHPEGTPYPATSIHGAGGCGTLDDVLSAFCATFKARWDEFLRDGFAPLRQEWLAHARGLGDSVTVDLEGTRLTGVFRDIAEDGALVLDRGAAGVKRITAGDVSFAPVPAAATGA
jgi:BirA family biotin operon repressor/biotin-[acetyl-CoA-carboxylase] ligase